MKKKSSWNVEFPTVKEAVKELGYKISEGKLPNGEGESVWCLLDETGKAVIYEDIQAGKEPFRQVQLVVEWQDKGKVGQQFTVVGITT